ncbi:MAG: hypothetical protein KKD39_05545, partial [Candidatus Altiarchaeota archaeon]|nr:hypothetical protein [Candidatus Altiarchaeota archaeon]
EEREKMLEEKNEAAKEQEKRCELLRKQADEWEANVKSHSAKVEEYTKKEEKLVQRLREGGIGVSRWQMVLAVVLLLASIGVAAYTIHQNYSRLSDEMTFKNAVESDNLDLCYSISDPIISGACEKEIQVQKLRAAFDELKKALSD